MIRESVVTTSANTVTKPTDVVASADALGVTKRMNTSNPESQESHECAGCGRSFESSAALGGHTVHCTDAVEYPDRVEVNCENCGETETVPPSEEDRYRFCSQKCQGEWQTENWTGEDAPNWQGGKSERACDWCESSFTPRRRGSPQRFCSEECYHDWYSETCVGEQHSRWAGGFSNHYGRNWTQQRQKALERDGYQCVVCGLASEEHHRQYDAELSVHHIQPLRSFDEPEDANGLKNLVTLCRSCHRKWEGIPLRPEVVK